ncbi:hypothetical protein V1498_19255 [Peribacillus sp. SCS-26]
MCGKKGSTYDGKCFLYMIRFSFDICILLVKNENSVKTTM